MIGGSGNDRYVVDNRSDVTTETNPFAGEIDSVFSSVNRTLGANLERLTLTGVAPLNGNGNALENILTGNAGANVLLGGAADDLLRGGGGDDSLDGGFDNDRLEGGSGHDTLNGGTDADTMIGGAGNDFYLVNSTGDSVVETGTSGSEIDRVQSSISYALGANVERLVLTGSAFSGSGNALANTISGTAAANHLSGAAGNDSLFGGGGNDSLNGGSGSNRLAGGTGADDFRFTRAPDGASNVDHLADFLAADDRLSLDNAVFAGLGAPGALAPAAFRAGSAAADASDRIVYDSATGRLLYDADGNGAGAAVLFATLASGTTLTAADLFVV